MSTSDPSTERLPVAYGQGAPAPLIRRLAGKLPLYLLAAVLTGRPVISPLTAEAGTLAFFLTLLLGAMAFWVLDNALKGRLRLQRSSGFMPMSALFLAWMLFAIYFSTDRFAGAKLWALLVSYAVTAFLALQCGSRPGNRRFLTACIMATGASLGFYALFHRIFIMPPFSEWVLERPEYFMSILDLNHGMRDAFMSRIGTRHATGGFLTGNQLASYLLMFLFPFAMLAAGSFAGFWRAGRRKASAGAKARLAAGLLLFGFIAAAFMWSGSKGGMLSAAIAGCGFAALGAKRSLLKLRRKLAVIISVLIAATLLSVFLFSLDLPGRRALKASLGVRIGYWDVSLRMAARNPVKGVGPGGWETYYTMLKPPQYEETRLPHSFYMLLLSESGIIGLLLFLLMTAAAFSAVLKAAGRIRTDDKECDDGAGAPAPAAGYVTAAVCLAFDYFLTGSLSGPDFAIPRLFLALPWMVYLLVFLVWAAAFHLIYTRRWIPDICVSLPAAMAVLCGLCALFVHAGAEFSMTIPAVGGTAFALIALLAAGRRQTYEINLNPVRTAAMALPAAAVFFLWAMFVTPGALDHYTGHRELIMLRTELARAETPGRRLEKKQALVDRYRQLVGLPPLFSSAPAPPAHGPAPGRWDAGLWADLAMQQLELAGLMHPRAAEELLAESEKAASEAIRLNPLKAKNHRVMGVILMETGRTEESLEYFGRAARLFPSLPRSWYEYAIAAERVEGPGSRACAAYRRAAELNDPRKQYHARNLLSAREAEYLSDRIKKCRQD